MSSASQRTTLHRVPSLPMEFFYGRLRLPWIALAPKAELHTQAEQDFSTRMPRAPPANQNQNQIRIILERIWKNRIEKEFRKLTKFCKSDKGKPKKKAGIHMHSNMRLNMHSNMHSLVLNSAAHGTFACQQASCACLQGAPNGTKVPHGPAWAMTPDPAGSAQHGFPTAPKDAEGFRMD